jgi:hypothetical protein
MLRAMTVMFCVTMPAVCAGAKLDGTDRTVIRVLSRGICLIGNRFVGNPFCGQEMEGTSVESNLTK